jgi:hypothetical protein
LPLEVCADHVEPVLEGGRRRARRGGQPDHDIAARVVEVDEVERVADALNHAGPEIRTAREVIDRHPRIRS